MERSAVETTPGFTNGKTTLKKDCNPEAPSICAASIISYDTSLKKDRIIQIIKDTFIAAYSRIRAIKESSKCTLLKTKYNGMIIPATGRKRVEITQNKISSFLFILYIDNA